MEEQGGPGGARPPTFFGRGGLAPSHFSVENEGIIKKKLLNAATGFGPLGRGMARPPHFKLRSSIYDCIWFGSQRYTYIKDIITLAIWHGPKMYIILRDEKSTLT